MSPAFLAFDAITEDLEQATLPDYDREFPLLLNRFHHQREPALVQKSKGIFSHRPATVPFLS